MRKKNLAGFLFCLLFSSCYNEKDYLPTNINPDEVIAGLYASNPVLPADGQSFTYIIAELPVNAVDARSTVTFTTTRGTFDNNNKTIMLAATLVRDNGQNKRIAKVKLVSSSTIEIADVTASIGGTTKVVSVTFTNLALDSFLTVSATSNTIPADGASFTTIIAEQPVNVQGDYNSITFTATAGVFDNGTKIINKSSALVLVNGVYRRIAQVRLTASKLEESAAIEIAIKGTLKAYNVNFKKAYPESIALTLGALSISPGYANSVQINTNLLRGKGTPTVNNEATTIVVDTNNVRRGAFINYNTKSDINGQVINKFTLGTDNYKGKLRVVATAVDSVGNYLVAESEIIAQ